jgi:hypothetical protein
MNFLGQNSGLRAEIRTEPSRIRRRDAAHPTSTFIGPMSIYIGYTKWLWNISTIWRIQPSTFILFNDALYISEESEYLSRYSEGQPAGRPEFDSRQGKIFIFFTASRPPLEHIQPIQWVPGALFPGVKRPGLEADHSPPSSAEFKNGGTIPPLPHMFSWYRA